MANEVVGIEIKAELAAFRAQLADIPKIGAKEARALTSQLSREIRKAESASKRAAAQSKKTAEAIKKQGKASADAAEDTGSLQKALLKAGAAAVGIALTMETAKKAFELTRDAVAELVGESEGVRSFGDEFRAVRDTVIVPLAASVEAVAGATADMLEEFRNTGALEEFQQRVRSVAVDVVVPALAAIGVSVAEVSARFELVADTAGVAFQRLKIAALAVTGQFAEAEQAVGELQTMQAKLDQATAEYTGTLDTARQVAGQWVETVTADIRQSTAALQVRSNQIQAEKRNTDAVKEGTEAVKVAEQVKRDEYERTLSKRIEVADAEQSITSSLASTAIGTALSVSESIIDGLQSVALANVKEARRRAEIELGLAILRGELQAAGAFGTTLATYGGTPQGFALAAAAAAAVGIQSKAAAAAGFAQASQQFHSGGEVRGASPAAEVPASLSPGEFVLNRQAVAAVGSDILGDLNAGQARPASSVGVFVVDHKVAGALTSKAMDDPGSRLSQRLVGLAPAVGGYAPHG